MAASRKGRGPFAAQKTDGRKAVRDTGLMD